jgi:hypothetical protein
VPEHLRLRHPKQMYAVWCSAESVRFCLVKRGDRGVSGEGVASRAAAQGGRVEEAAK